jgi:hypothetical protein
MTTSDRTFNQVKAILGKLDRAVDEARHKRTTPPVPQAPQISQPAMSQSIGAGPTSAPASIIAPAAAPQPAQPARASQYGRAQPLRPSSQAQPVRWTTQRP